MKDLILCDVYAKDLKGLFDDPLSKKEEGRISTNVVLSKLIAEINYQIFSASMKRKMFTDYSVGEEIFPDEDILSIIMEMMITHFEKHGFEVCHRGNVISLDWSENGPYGELDDDVEQFYENMHKQKTKKQHAPRKHNLKVIK